MADTVADVMGNVEANTMAKKTPVTTAELFMAYTCLAVMVIISIIIGSCRSRIRNLDGRSKSIIDRKKALKMTIILCQGAIIFIASWLCAVLCILYWNATWKKEGQEASKSVHSLKWFHVLRSYIDLFKVLKICVMFVSVVELYYFVKPCLNNYIACCFCVCVGGINCLMSKSLWVTNNSLGIALSANMIASVHLNSMRTGCVFLGGLLVCDVFMVFGTDIMTTVANEMDVPIKLIFPADVLTNGIAADKFAMIGLGDIVVPGFFIALLTRFDKFRNHEALYFSSGLFGYVVGLIIAITVAEVSDHDQPALLYLAPLTISVPLLVALMRGELAALFAYEEVALQVIGTDQVIVVPTDEFTSTGTCSEEETDDDELSEEEVSDDAKERKKDK